MVSFHTLRRAAPIIAGVIGMAASAQPSSAEPLQTPPSDCGLMTSPYDYTQQAASACYVTDPLVSVTTLPDGGTQYTYRQTSGLLASETVPPAGFDPANAPASELAEYGLPPRPASFVALVDWQNEVSKDWWPTPPAFLAELPAAQQSPPPPAGPGGNFAGWAGHITANYGSSTSDVYTEPHLGSSCSNDGVAVWGGLGAGSEVFGQDGTQSDTGHGSHVGFWQVWAGGTEEGTGVLQTVAAGDSMRANVNYPANEFTGTLTDVSTGKVEGWSFGVFGSAPSQAEAVVEHQPGFSLTNFGTTNFASSSGDGQPLNNLDPSKYTPGDGSMSTSSLGGGGSFSVHYVHC